MGQLVSLESSGSFDGVKGYLQKLKDLKILDILSKYGAQGVSALSGATPEDTGETANSWYYTVGQADGAYWIDFHNYHEEGGELIAILVQYGHATRNGGYVVGRDFINPAIAPVFDQIKADVWKAVTSV